MVEKLTVKNFAGIEELEIEVKRINIVIGPQASGKSVCAKLLFYFKNFVWKILDTVENEQTKPDIDLSYSQTFQDYFPPDSWGENNFYIKYEISEGFIEITRNKENTNKININYSEFFKNLKEELLEKLKKFDKQRYLINSLIDYKIKLTEENNKKSDDLTSLLEQIEILLTRVKENPESNETIIKQSFLREQLIEFLSSSLWDEAAYTQLFIPAGRSFFYNLQSSIFSLISNKSVIDTFMIKFGSTYESIKALNARIIKETEDINKKEINDEIDSLIKKILCGEHIQEKGEDFLRMADGRRISIANSSSGQQETFPLTIILSALPFLVDEDSAGQTVYIEEPEAHLFPSAQRKMVELIACVFNSDPQKQKLQFFITTHSPYILTSINNLLQAGMLYKESSQDVLPKLEEIVPRYKALSTLDLSAYVLENGKAENILDDKETGLINANLIDGVSDELAIEFDELLDLA
ncbi:MAG: AAA family ATPase [Moorea sp. SIO3I7]|uniref:AAA family ATPase n=1 Tax=Moorena sp. SIO3I8 TaxID=2607833 RepID=UPI0013C1200F|nr:AAA family ATPase [Moorena sp. SIO3I8]NEN99458.1 AAA family ATPase [Moorena sp. SIO3I7]NEO09309.1 AAA family ATPase [Moorena sp. SIO3I8]